MNRRAGVARGFGITYALWHCPNLDLKKTAWPIFPLLGMLNTYIMF